MSAPPQTRPAPSAKAEPAAGRRGVLTVSDSVEQPRLKGHGKRKSRFSIKRHLQKHGLAQADSDSDLEAEDSE